MPSNNIYVFDFDGVVCDSTPECLVTSWNAWESFNNRDNFRESLNEFSKDDINSFKELRYYVKGASDYYFLRRLLAEKREGVIKSYKDFEKIKEINPEHAKVFKKTFFESRNKLKLKSIENWINLHEVYEEVISILKNFALKKKLYIATLKDDESVKIILDKYNLNLKDEYIFHQGIIQTKIEALSEIRNIEKVDKEQIYLFDDNVDHLKEPHLAGFNSYQTTWGNVPSDYIIESKKMGIPLINLDNLKDLITS